MPARTVPGSLLLSQSEKLIERILDGEMFELRKSRFACQFPRALLANHRTQSRATVSQRYGHTVERADGMKSLSDRIAVFLRVRRGIRLRPYINAVIGKRLPDGCHRAARI